MRIIFSFFVLAFLLSCEQIEIDDLGGNFDFSLMSFNLRYDEPADGENQWSNRKEACLDMLNEIQPHVFGVQEALQNQVDFLNDNLAAYDFVGVGRDNGETSGEYSAIFYSRDHFELLENGNFWLSESPESPSLGWDANNIRIVSWAKLNDLDQNRTIYVFNTHFDHKGKIAQEKSSELLIQKIQEIAEADASVFITGDFNMLIGNERLTPITENYFSAQRFAESSDNHDSFNAFGRWYLNRNIDFIFYQHAEAISYHTIVKDYGVPFISDHYPIFSRFNYR